MSSKTAYFCDHCGAECSGDEWASIGHWEESKRITFGKTIHGCSKEHLGFALAKLFGIAVDGNADELLNRNRRELAKLTDANVFLAQEKEALEKRIVEQKDGCATLHAKCERLQKRVWELEAHIADLQTVPSITDPTKPTKPLHARIKAYIERIDNYAQDKDHPSEYRDALRDVAAELRSLLHDGVDFS